MDSEFLLKWYQSRSRRRGLRSLMLLACLLHCAGHVFAATVESPNGRVRLDVKLLQRDSHAVVAYSIRFDDTLVIAESTIGFTPEDGVVIGDRLEQTAEPKRQSHSDEWRPVYGERSIVRDIYNELTLTLRDSAAKCGMTLVFRCYDAGAAFQATLRPEVPKQGLAIKDENSEFCFLSDHVAWCTNSAQGKYESRRISEIRGEVERPLVVQVDGKKYVAIGEAGLVNYARMRLIRDPLASLCLCSKLSSAVKSEGELTTPWRVVMVASTPGELLTQNDIFLNLNKPRELKDTSWIKPGKVIRDTTLSNKGAKACIDFAASNNLQFIEFDAGWYGPERNDGSDATNITFDPGRKSGPFNLPGIIDYANHHDIGVILYVNQLALEKQLDDILPLYQKLGIAGVKFGFVQVGSQEWTAWLHEAVRKAADHRLMVDIHDEYRPTGYSRTYPNLMTQEGVRGDEASPSSEHELTTLFTRYLAGAADHTVCYFDKRVEKFWSHGFQLAKAVCFYSPWQFLYWYDTPLSGPGYNNSITEAPELEFFARLPTTWDDIKVVHGEIGKYAVIARRSGKEWYVGAMNNSQPRSLDLPLSFLGEGQVYFAFLYEDDPQTPAATHVRITRKKVNSETVLHLPLQRNGGYAIRLVPF
ncbi:MAG TPA: glycoside hydrolase family 97 N-terminal domain-containing protein [Lacipirellulaceae bacterium]|jgi:alpha-glucosidase|nr:glycoside hydrolase family 97 N-terminal domain-containing protein [Lacipirellulaceae bacterium]